MVPRWPTVHDAMLTLCFACLKSAGPMALFAELALTDGEFESCQAPDDTDASWRTWSALGALRRAVCFHALFACLYRRLRHPTKSATRVRDLFPLPLIARTEVCMLVQVHRVDLDHACQYLAGVVTGLNWMYCVREDTLAIGNLTVAQDTAHGVIMTATMFLHTRLVEGIADRATEGWMSFERKGEAPRLDLLADAVAVPDCAGTCCPSTIIGGDVGGQIGSVDAIFPNPPPGLDLFLSVLQWEAMGVCLAHR